MSDSLPVRLQVDCLQPDPAVLREAIRVLASGHLVGYPTDTLYGLGADARHSEAIERLFRAKDRPPEMAVPLIAGDVEQVDQQVGRLTPLARRLAERFWPGPLTLVLTAVPPLNRRLLAGGDSVAVRVPDHPVAMALARDLRYPVTATSANRSGAEAPATAVATMRALGSKLSLVLDSGSTEAKQASTIVDVRGATPLLLRAGAVSWDHVIELLS